MVVTSDVIPDVKFLYIFDKKQIFTFANNIIIISQSMLYLPDNVV